MRAEQALPFIENGIILFLLGAALAAVAAWIFFARIAQRLRHQLRVEQIAKTALAERLMGREEQIASLQELAAELDRLRVEKAAQEAQIQEERRSFREREIFLEQTKKSLTEAFKAASADVVHNNNQTFMQLARANLEKFQEQAKADLETKQKDIHTLVKPVQDSLQQLNSKLHDLEKVRVGAYEGLAQQVRSMAEVQNHLRSETSNLVRALHRPMVRGRWGEIQLKRVVELAGMVAHCDFVEQESVSNEEGRFRPDLIVRLPGGKNIVVDAKAPLQAYLEAVESSEESVRLQKMADHARQIRNHVLALSRKSYWDQFQPAPEFVVLFLPGEPFFSAALEHDPALIEAGVENHIILSTPTTLIALLRAVAYGWRQEALSQNALKISELGRELYKRLADLSGHWNKVGRSLATAVQSYNRAVASLESRVLVSARRFRDLESGAEEELEELIPLEQTTRQLQAPEMEEKALIQEPALDSNLDAAKELP